MIFALWTHVVFDQWVCCLPVFFNNSWNISIHNFTNHKSESESIIITNIFLLVLENWKRIFAGFHLNGTSPDFQNNISNSRTSYLLCKCTWQGKVDVQRQQNVVPPVSHHLRILDTSQPVSHFSSIWAHLSVIFLQPSDTSGNLRHTLKLETWIAVALFGQLHWVLVPQEEQKTWHSTVWSPLLELPVGRLWLGARLWDQAICLVRPQTPRTFGVLQQIVILAAAWSLHTHSPGHSETPLDTPLQGTL